VLRPVENICIDALRVASGEQPAPDIQQPGGTASSLLLKPQLPMPGAKQKVYAGNTGTEMQKPAPQNSLRKAGVTITVYPNPAIDNFTISSETLTLRRVELYNASGEKVMEQENMSGKKQNIQVKKLPAGLYTVKCIGTEGVAETRLVIQ
jgi:hypothetical protein